MGLIGQGVDAWMPDGALKDLLVDGVIGGVGSVIVFLPNIMILYLFIAFMEDSGYLARAAFIMDRIMHRIGLHGKSFIPLIMGFGCNVPAVLGTRIVESKKERLLTIFLSPFIPCTARQIFVPPAFSCLPSFRTRRFILPDLFKAVFAVFLRR